MRIFLRFFLVLSLLHGIVYGLDFKQTKVIKLKKDEQKKILVKYDNIIKLFEFRWTLYKNGGLVIHRSYDKIISQNILYKRYKNNSFRLELKSPGAGKYYNLPYILVKFEDFDFKTDEAIFKLFLYDDAGNVSLKEIK
ncbi:hypothetical protein FJR48_04740 [Sulfurimonas lithotrophica]|uniref:Uncharacterized protein n=1 Tax=Sulfurimonas lithotrophica TaxID=2590022 RepID=A0A5P8P044_9BACT|nr:hypothetical protein [Sulfurimonas lithotrophica]QFR49069.1 hypothetical protein FJR48_04740 [Sulfurimonas lithotrophica]